MSLTKVFNRIIWGSELDLPPKLLREEKKQDQAMEEIVRGLEKGNTKLQKNIK